MELFRRRTFQQPYSGATQTVGGESIFWALLTGPIYYWKKGALIEAIVVAILTLLPLFVSDETPLIGSIQFSYAVWAASILLAPILISNSYKRRGWTEIHEQ